MNGKRHGTFTGIATALMIMVFMAMPAMRANAQEYYTKAEVDALLASFFPSNVYRVSTDFTAAGDAQLRKYPSIQAAVNAIEQAPAGVYEIQILPGSYDEDVTIDDTGEDLHWFDLEFSKFASLNGTADNPGTAALTINDARVSIDGLYTNPLLASINKDVYIDFNPVSAGFMSIEHSYFVEQTIRIEGGGISFAFVSDTSFDLSSDPDRPGVAVQDFEGWQWGVVKSEFRPNSLEDEAYAIKIMDGTVTGANSIIGENTFHPHTKISIDNGMVYDLTQNYLSDSQVVLTNGGSITNWVDRAPHNLLPAYVVEVSPGFTVDPAMRHYPRIQDAVDAVISDMDGMAEIIIDPGIYDEDVTIANNTNGGILLEFSPGASLTGSANNEVPALTITNAVVQIDNLWTTAAEYNKDVYIDFNWGIMLISNSYISAGSQVGVRLRGGGMAYVLNTTFDITRYAVGVEVNDFHFFEWGLHTSEFRPNGPYTVTAVKLINSTGLGHIAQCTFSPNAQVYVDANSSLRTLNQSYLDDSQVIIEEGGEIVNWLDRPPHIPE